jgi:hypothetical protein
MQPRAPWLGGCTAALALAAGGSSSCTRSVLPVTRVPSAAAPPRPRRRAWVPCRLRRSPGLRSSARTQCGAPPRSPGPSPCPPTAAAAGPGQHEGAGRGKGGPDQPCAGQLALETPGAHMTRPDARFGCDAHPCCASGVPPPCSLTWGSMSMASVMLAASTSTLAILLSRLTLTAFTLACFCSARPPPRGILSLPPAPCLGGGGNSIHRVHRKVGGACWPAGRPALACRPAASGDLPHAPQAHLQCLLHSGAAAAAHHALHLDLQLHGVVCLGCSGAGARWGEGGGGLSRGSALLLWHPPPPWAPSASPSRRR